MDTNPSQLNQLVATYAIPLVGRLNATLTGYSQTSLVAFAAAGVAIGMAWSGLWCESSSDVAGRRKAIQRAPRRSGRARH